MTSKKSPEALSVPDQIRKAYKAGKETLIINGVDFNITRQDHTITVEGEKRTESWLAATPVSRSNVVPVYNIELEPGKNTRVTAGKKQ